MSEEERREQYQEVKTSKMAFSLFIGKISLCMAIGGIVIPPIFAQLMAIVLWLNDFDAQQFYSLLPWFHILGLILEIVALVMGIIGFRNAYGKVGLIVSAILLAFTTVCWVAV
jgi:hypothetical protein